MKESFSGDQSARCHNLNNIKNIAVKNNTTIEEINMRVKLSALGKNVQI